VKSSSFNYFCGILLDKIVYPYYEVIITIDKKHTNSLFREDFNKYIQSRIKEKNSNLKVEIFHKPSYNSNELQVVDFVAWSIHRKFSFDDDYYYKIIEEKIKNKKSMILWE